MARPTRRQQRRRRPSGLGRGRRTKGRGGTAVPGEDLRHPFRIADRFGPRVQLAAALVAWATIGVLIYAMEPASPLVIAVFLVLLFLALALTCAPSHLWSRAALCDLAAVTRGHAAPVSPPRHPRRRLCRGQRRPAAHPCPELPDGIVDLRGVCDVRADAVRAEPILTEGLPPYGPPAVETFA